VFKKEQQAFILHQVNLHKVLPSSLSANINVSEDTTRRDLQELADEGKVIKVHGGALSHSFSQVHFDKDAASTSEGNFHFRKYCSDPGIYASSEYWGRSYWIEYSIATLIKKISKKSNMRKFLQSSVALTLMTLITPPGYKYSKERLRERYQALMLKPL